MTQIPANTELHTVSELTQQIKSLLETGFPSVWVTGEVSNLAKPRSGHLYFGLKDAESQLRSVIWRGIALRLKFDLRDGQEINARGRITVYKPRGEYQFVIEELQPKGIGALDLALRQLREKLFVKGYFDPKRKKPLPRFPKRIALVTSPTGAAIRDILQILARRWPAAEVWVCGVTVQGDGAAEDIAAAIRRVNQMRPQVDVLITGRGGGSLEDLWAFNEEPVADAIYESKIPVVSAVGHEVDLTIADLVADQRALTPSEAGEIVVPDRVELQAELVLTERRLKETLVNRLQTAWQKWQDLAQRSAFRLPLERIREMEHRVDDWSERLQRASRQRLVTYQQQVEALSAQLESLSPLNVLARGYSLTRNQAGKVIRSTDQVQPGDRLETRLQQGTFVSRVESIENKL